MTIPEEFDKENKLKIYTGIKTGNFIRIPYREYATNFEGKALLLVNGETEDMCVCISSEYEEHHVDLRVVSYSAKGFKIGDGHISIRV